MYYSVDYYFNGRWHNWMETASETLARERWESLVEKGETARVRECRDVTSGTVWL